MLFAVYKRGFFFFLYFKKHLNTFKPNLQQYTFKPNLQQ